MKTFRSCCPELFFGRSLLKICSKFTGELPYLSVISIKLQSSFIEIALWLGCSPLNLLHIFRTPFHKNFSVEVLLNFDICNLVFFSINRFIISPIFFKLGKLHVFHGVIKISCFRNIRICGKYDTKAMYLQCKF